MGIEDNCCEHGDHLAPPGKRFCSLACQACEAYIDYDCSKNDCGGLCMRGQHPCAQEIEDFYRRYSSYLDGLITYEQLHGGIDNDE